jgi:hypothetical protein
MSEGQVHFSSEGGRAGAHTDIPDSALLVGPTVESEHNTLKAGLLPIACWRVEDIRFDFASSFVRPEIAREIAALYQLREEHKRALPPGSDGKGPVQNAFAYPPRSIFGHADPVGEDDFNKQLSGRRATAIYALLTRRVELWEELYSQPLADDKWGEESILTIQTHLGLEATGKADKGTRKALFGAYMESLCTIRDDAGNPRQEADGSAMILILDKDKDFLGRGQDSAGKADYQGCSEFNPVLLFSQAEAQKFAAAKDKTERNQENAPNRRVMALLFRVGSKVDPAKWPCPRVKEKPTACKKRFWSDGQKRRSNQAERREYNKTKDTFACRFYDRLNSRSPCEEIVELSQPTFYTIERPGATNYVRLHSLYAYLVRFRRGSNELECVHRHTFKEGKLWDLEKNARAKIVCNSQAWLYFSHRDDLLELDQAKWFARDKSGFPLLGPFTIPCGPDAKVELDVWQQKDWAIVHSPRVDGAFPDNVKMAEWREDYQTGQLLPMVKGGMGFFPHGDYKKKQQQERWKGAENTTIDLIHWGNPDTHPMWVGTLSALPSDKAKLLLVHKAGGNEVYGTSYNELAPTGENQIFPGHHQYDQKLVAQLLAVPDEDQGNAKVDALPTPPARCLLPGDACWQDQGQTNNCGAFSFSTAMNYWMPYTNNPEEKDGKLYAQPGNVDDTINGARTPKDIVNAAAKFKMNGRDNDAEDLDRSRALKLVKLWLQAGVPVLILVKEEYNLWSYHWKTVVGYDGDRFFMNNSGADNEVVRAERTPGIDYEHAPVGNDVDSAKAFWEKWKAAGGDIVDAFTSVDECTFIPLFPKDPMFAGGKAK